MDTKNPFIGRKIKSKKKWKSPGSQNVQVVKTMGDRGGHAVGEINKTQYSYRSETKEDRKILFGFNWNKAKAHIFSKNRCARLIYYRFKCMTFIGSVSAYRNIDFCYALYLSWNRLKLLNFLFALFFSTKYFVLILKKKGGGEFNLLLFFFFIFLRSIFLSWESIKFLVKVIYKGPLLLKP